MTHFRQCYSVSIFSRILKLPVLATPTPLMRINTTHLVTGRGEVCSQSYSMNISVCVIHGRHHASLSLPAGEARGVATAPCWPGGALLQHFTTTTSRKKRKYYITIITL